LNLASCSVDCLFLNDVISKLTKLDLNLSNNAISPHGITLLNYAIAQYPSLQNLTLSLADNKLG